MLIRDLWITRGLVPEIAAQTGSHRRTVENWIRNGKIPETSYRLLDITQNGNLDVIHSDWYGWKISGRTGQMYTPNGEKISQGDILAIRYRKHLIAQMQLELRETRARIRVNRANRAIENELAVRFPL